MNNCVFCKEGADFSSAISFLGTDWPYKDRIVYSDNYLFSVVGYGPQVSPYVLIIPYRHIFSLAQMDEMELNSFFKCLNFLCASGKFDTQVCFFEHGGSSEDGSSSIDHCHIHVIDSKSRLFDFPSFSDFQYIQCISELSYFTSAYFLVGKYSDGRLEMKVKEDLLHEHQYFRKVLAEILGEKEWNWKLNMRRDMMLDSMKMFH